MKKELGILILAIIATIGFSGAVAAQPISHGPMHGPAMGHYMGHHPMIMYRHHFYRHFFYRHHFYRHFFYRHHFYRHYIPHRLY